MFKDKLRGVMDNDKYYKTSISISIEIHSMSSDLSGGGTQTP